MKYMNSALVLLYAHEATRSITTVSGFTSTALRSPPDAQKFLERFGGERFDPGERGRGANWARWRKR